MKKLLSQLPKDILSNLVASIIILLAVFLVSQVGKLFVKSITDQMANFLAVLIFAICFAIWVLKYWSDKRIKDKYYATVASDEFKEFAIEAMKRYYGEEYLTKINGTIIAEYCFPTSGMVKYSSSIKDFDKLCNKDESKISDFNLNKNYKKIKFYKKYRRINKNEIKRPYHPGFMLEKASINNDGLVNNISVRLGFFAENVYTSDILEYELYEAFLHFNTEWKNIKEKDVQDESFWEKVHNSLEIRNNITEENGNAYNSLLNGNGRQSLITVQMIVVFKDKNTGKYKVHMIQRSDDVAQAPGEYQLVPCGGFDVLHESKNNSYNPYVLEENLSPGSCVFREYLEEVIEGKDKKVEYEGQGTGAVESLVLKNPNITEICKMLTENKASLQFLGSSVSLVLLRHTLSFALVIHDESFSQKPFIGNHEVKGGDILNISISLLDNPQQDCWQKMNAGSIASWYMFTKTKEYEEIMKNNVRNNNSNEMAQ